MTTTLSAIDLPFEEAIAYLRQKANVTSEHYADVFGVANVKSFTVAGAATEALVGDFRGEVAKALESGTSLGEFRAGFDDIVRRHGWEHTGSPGWRARTIFETNLGMAYSAGRYAQQTEPETLAAFPFWQYVHSGSLHPRLDHKALDGITLRADDPFWLTHYTPNGWGCGCWIRSVSARQLARMGKSGPDVAPPIEWRSWTNPRTGEVVQVPKGIDPGFAYNPGREWKAERVDLPANATLTAVRPIDLPMPPASTPALPPVVPQAPTQGPALVVPPAPVPAPSPIAVRAASRADAEAADKLLTSDFAGWARRLRPAEMDALSGYKGVLYREMNEQLRGDRVMSYLQPAIDALDAALARARTARPMTVYRGVTSRARYAQAQLGDVIEERGFLSASVNPETAGSFAAGDIAVIEIRLPQAYAGGAYVNHVPDLDHLEFEFLFRPGARFRVVERTGGRIVVEPVRRASRRASKAAGSPG